MMMVARQGFLTWNKAQIGQAVNVLWNCLVCAIAAIYDDRGIGDYSCRKH